MRSDSAIVVRVGMPVHAGMTFYWRRTYDTDTEAERAPLERHRPTWPQCQSGD